MKRSEAFTDLRRNCVGLAPRPAEDPDERCVHRQVTGDGAACGFSQQRAHPVFPVRLPARSLSMSIGTLAPGQATRNHRHAYEAVMYVMAGSGHSVIEGRRIDWQAGDAVYTPPWCWHRHIAGDEPVEYTTATNMPMLEALGQTVMREEDPSD